MRLGQSRHAEAQLLCKKPFRGNLMYARYVTGITMLALATLTTTALAYQVPGARVGIPVGHNLPPAQMLMEPGPGVGGPGPGVLNRSSRGGPMDGGAVYGPFGAVTTQSVQVLFDQPKLMNISWDVSAVGRYDSAPWWFRVGRISPRAESSA